MIRIHRILLAACAFALTAAPAAAQSSSAASWRTDVPCTAGRNPTVRVARAADSARVAGCVRAYCVALPNGRRVCTCTRDTTIVVRVEQGGRTAHEWPANYSMAGGSQSLRAMEGDLDGDGRPELIVSEWMDMSNGLGIRYHRLSIFDGAHPERAPLRVNVDDFTPEGSFVRPAAGGPCRLIATRWTELRDARRGEGMYFTGQWMRYRDGRLEHDVERPVVVRRLLNSFRPWAVSGGPLAHFRDRRAEAWSGVPAILPPLATTRTGSLMRVRDDSVDVALTPHDIQVFSYVGAPAYGDDDGNMVSSLLVDGATGRPWPRGYNPADPAVWQRAPVTIRTYREEGRIVKLLVLGTPPAANGTR
ncbi:MAG TPA: hypothetical protein VGX50_19120 [Longimicrobium sp.]|jgi:hypothetical protein|nr:hypothetical protein [Longimicrobium sp.]